MYPYTAWKDSFIHSAFENAGATLSGVEAVSYTHLDVYKRQASISIRGAIF